MNEQTQKIFEDFLKQYKLESDSDEFFRLTDKLLAGLVTKDDYIRSVIADFKLPVAKFYTIKTALDEILKDQRLAGLAPVSTKAIDVEPAKRREDAIFHALLDFLHSLKLGADQEKKLFNIFLSYLKGVRDEIEILETLQKEELKGGLAMGPKQAQPIIDQFNNTLKNLSVAQFSADYASKWFRSHFDTILLSQPVTGKVQDLAIAPETEKPAPAHTWAGEVSHDLNQPLVKHIGYHRDILNKTPEISAPVKPLPIAPAVKPAAKPLSEVKIPAQSQRQASPAAAPTPPAVMVPAPKPKVMPEPLKQMVERESAMSAPALPPSRPALTPAAAPAVQQIQAAPDIRPIQSASAASVAPQPASKKPGFFKRLFGAKAKPANPLNQQVPFYPPSPARQAEAGRPTMADITYAPKLYTPVDELASLTLADFRRLAKDPAAATKKISDKLDLLAQDSFEKKADGIAALKRSGLYKDYSDIMNASVIAGKPFTEILAVQNTLTEEEFRALTALNKKLRS